MSEKFKVPDFRERGLELKMQDGEICIYGSPDGIRELVTLCEQLLNKPQQGHIHLSDRDLLTRESLEGVLAIFPEFE